MKLKFWIGFGEHAIFSKKDRTMFYVLPADGNAEMKIERAAFVEGDDLKKVRDSLVAEIDKWYDHELHMVSLEKRVAKSKVVEAQETKLDQTRTSLAIESMDSAPAPKPTGDLFNGLLDL
jgi:hypothetical protein